MQRWVKRYDGTIESLRLKSRRPHSHPNQHTAEELSLKKRVYSKFKHEGLAQVYTEAKKRGYTRLYGSMCCQIRRNIPKIKEKKQYYKSKWKPDVVTYLNALLKAHQRYASRYNNIAQKILGFKSPNEYIAEYFLNKSLGGCVTNVCLL